MYGNVKYARNSNPICNSYIFSSKVLEILKFSLYLFISTDMRQFKRDRNSLFVRSELAGSEEDENEVIQNGYKTEILKSDGILRKNARLAKLAAAAITAAPITYLHMHIVKNSVPWKPQLSGLSLNDDSTSIR
uniref:Uncharacterized protein n=1 Tax=Glossina palpalis gambiensis TaxID=67801 RepID=A0A1B0AY64_9MUSC